MPIKLFSAEDILALFKKQDKCIDKLECWLEECCSKVPVNIGSGVGLYKGFSSNQWEFKSLIAGSNITITNNGDDITISGSVVPFVCQDVLDCLGISPSGNPSKFLNEQGDFLAISPHFITSVSDTNSINLTVAAGDLSADLKIQDTSQIDLTVDGLGLKANFASLLISQFTNDVPYLTGITGWKVTGNTGLANAGILGTLDDNGFTIVAGGNTVGNVNSNQSVSLGDGSAASGDGSMAFGKIALSTGGTGSVAFGNQVTASGATSIAIGNTTTVSGNSSVGISLGGAGLSLTQANSFAVMNGNSGFGTVTPSATIDLVGTFQYVDGNQGSSKFLTSDASGNASWATLPTPSGLVASVSGTANRITSSGTTNPVIDIAGTYVGQTSITTLGTITTGVWNSTPVITTYGGTGLASYAQGDLLYYNSSTAFSKLAKDTNATRYLSNQGTSNNPSWNQVNLANGVTGILPQANGGTGQAQWDGWIADGNTWTYSSVDGATGVITINADVTALIQAGDRIKFTQTTVKYFIVTATPTFAAGNTTLTFWGGTDYTLVNAAISSPSFSHIKNPFGFNTSPAKWSVLVTDTSLRTQATPTANTWYNIGTTNDQIVIPIGVWDVQYSVNLYWNSSSNTSILFYKATLSTANNTESDKMWTISSHSPAFAVASDVSYTSGRRNTLTLAAKTTYYLNALISTGTNIANIFFAGSVTTTTINAVCGYL